MKHTPVATSPMPGHARVYPLVLSVCAASLPLESCDSGHPYVVPLPIRARKGPTLIRLLLTFNPASPLCPQFAGLGSYTCGLPALAPHDCHGLSFHFRSVTTSGLARSASLPSSILLIVRSSHTLYC
ncbi:hypothetical protein BCR44DRAFT_200629 [Catenaria anguillulae PL171]|uniref:Uncharacterized protein n=1 Tax=Catenaria anguillulae PL171 TaxID=765915 RepID=A0A1Y2HUN2_9FUNG|nr:hypothetical protein BCR44DRAFT_200629 [Catenaria anguillulae PL171]